MAKTHQQKTARALAAAAGISYAAALQRVKDARRAGALGVIHDHTVGHAVSTLTSEPVDPARLEQMRARVRGSSVQRPEKGTPEHAAWAENMLHEAWVEYEKLEQQMLSDVLDGVEP